MAPRWASRPAADASRLRADLCSPLLCQGGERGLTADARAGAASDSDSAGNSEIGALVSWPED
jgi:hypothetical protein